MGGDKKTESWPLMALWPMAAPDSLPPNCFYLFEGEINLYLKCLLFWFFLFGVV